jgi:photosystem II stability/assembly factor-like uncharacterized protein
MFKTISIYIIILFINSICLLAQTGWVTLNSGTSFNLLDVKFIDSNTGYFVARDYSSSNSILRKTIDGGNSWSTVLSITYLNKIYFINQNTGTAVGALGTIRKTTNGGSTWITQVSPAGSSALLGVFFTNENTGFIAGDFNTVLFTTDGGSTWVNRPFGPSDGKWRDAFFFDANTGFVAGMPPTGQAIIKTTNGGLNWVYVLGPVGSFNRISFLNNITGFCVGQGSSFAIAKTINGGDNWEGINNTGSFDFNGLAVINTNGIIISGAGGKIFRSDNGGLNWLQQTSGTSKRLHGVSFINSNSGWVCGDTGTLLKTTNGGITGVQQISNETPETFILTQNYPNPFNPVTAIKLQIPKRSFTKLIVYDLNGREAAVLVREELNSGTYEIKWDAALFSSGIYFYSLEANGFKDTKTMVLVK